MEQIPLTLENMTQAFRDFSEKKRKEMADKGTAMEDGSYPIATRQDLKNAIQAIGRAKNPEAVRRHIKKRARALGLTELIPEGWSADGFWGEAFALEAFDALPDAMTGLVPGKPIQLFRIGDTVTIDKRKIRITADDALALLEDAHGRENDLPIMYQHGEDPTRGFEAGGWVDPKSITVRDGGIWADRPYWQRDLHDSIREGRWRYVSPHVYPQEKADDDGFLRPASWLEISLTNIPAIQGMAPVQASVTNTTPVDAGARIGNAPSAMAANKGDREMVLPKESLARLGLAEDASDEAVIKAIDELHTKANPPAPTPAPVAEPAPVAAAAEPALTAAAVAEMVAAEAKKLADDEKQKARIAAALQKATESGKVTAAMRPGAEKFAAADIEAFEKFVDAAPVVAPVAKGTQQKPTATIKPQRFSTDFIGEAAASLDPERVALDRAAHVYAAENKTTYAQAVLALSRR